MKTIEKIAAEILVQSGYAESWAINGNDDLVIGWIVSSDFDGSKWDAVDPFADTLEGRRQADAIEDYFEQRPDLWDLWNSFKRPYVYDIGESMREWRLDRMYWCLKEIRSERTAK